MKGTHAGGMVGEGGRLQITYRGPIGRQLYGRHGEEVDQRAILTEGLQGFLLAQLCDAVSNDAAGVRGEGLPATGHHTLKDQLCPSFSDELSKMRGVVMLFEFHGKLCHKGCEGFGDRGGVLTGAEDLQDWLNETGEVVAVCHQEVDKVAKKILDQVGRGLAGLAGV